MKKWFRFSLLTLVLLHFEAAGLLWANLQVRTTKSVVKIESSLGYEDIVEQGWPMVFYRKTHRLGNLNGYMESTTSSSFAGYSIFIPFVWLGMLGATAAVSEYFVRKRKTDGAGGLGPVTAEQMGPGSGKGNSNGNR